MQYDFHKTVQDPNHGEFTHQYFRQHKPDLLPLIKRKANKPPQQEVGTVKKGSKAGGGGASSCSSAASPPSSPAGASAVGSSAVMVMGRAGAVGGNVRFGGMDLGPLPVPRPLTGTDLRFFTDEGDYTDMMDSSSSSNSISKGDYQLVSSYFDCDEESLGRKMLVPEEVVLETDSVLGDIHQMNSSREHFERRMEAKIAKLESENVMLKKQFRMAQQKNVVMQERMEKVLKTLYSIYMSGGGVQQHSNLSLSNLKAAVRSIALPIDVKQTGRSLISFSSFSLSSSSTSQNIFTDFPLVRDNQRPHDAPQLHDSSSSSRYPCLSSLHLNAASEEVQRAPDPAPPLDRLDSIGLDRLDSIGLLRLPSINLEELQHVSGTTLMMSPAGEGSSWSQWRAPRGGCESSLPLPTRGDSFDVAASSVAGVPLQQQTSFDHQYSSLFDPQTVKSEQHHQQQQQPVDEEEVRHRPDAAVSFAPGIAYCEGDHQAGRPLSRQLPFSSRSVGDKRAGAQQERSAKQSKLNDQSECCLT